VAAMMRSAAASNPSWPRCSRLAQAVAINAPLLLPAMDGLMYRPPVQSVTCQHGCRGRLAEWLWGNKCCEHTYMCLLLTLCWNDYTAFVALPQKPPPC